MNLIYPFQLDMHVFNYFFAASLVLLSFSSRNAYAAYECPNVHIAIYAPTPTLRGQN